MNLKKINEIIDKYKSDDYSGDVVFEYIPEYNFKEFANKLLEAINYSCCCTTLKDEEETAFDLWLKNFKHAERDLYWYNEDTLYCIEAMKDIYNTEVKPTL